MSAEPLPVLPHLASEFYLWLWWRSETQGSVFDLPDPVGRIECWVDERLAFRAPEQDKVTAVLTGERAADSLEARAALYGGKVVHEVRLQIRRDEREFVATLKGPDMRLSQLKLPAALQDNPEEAILDRVFLFDELSLVLQGLLRAFADARLEPSWTSEVLPSIRGWCEGADL